jgi:hypothetical protein
MTGPVLPLPSTGGSAPSLQPIPAAAPLVGPLGPVPATIGFSGQQAVAGPSRMLSALGARPIRHFVVPSRGGSAMPVTSEAGRVAAMTSRNTSMRAHRVPSNTRGVARHAGLPVRVLILPIVVRIQQQHVKH